MKKIISLLIVCLMLVALSKLDQNSSLYAGTPGKMNDHKHFTATDLLVNNDNVNNFVQKTPVINKSFDGVFHAKNFSSAVVDENNTKWFVTEAGIVSFDDKIWSIHNKNSKIPTENLKDLVFDYSASAPELLIATPNGAAIARLPIDDKTDPTFYNTENTSILSNNVFQIAIGKNDIYWFGTDKGVSAFRNKKWLTNSYEEVYPGILFKEYPITSMATNPGGDSLYVGTKGAGIERVFRDDVDGVSGASVYAQWGPIILPSDSIYSILIASDHKKWFGTDMGVASHLGNNTLENWTVYTTDDGLVNNFVQAIAEDKKGKLWFGTKGGVSVFDGSAWSSFKMEDGLSSNNILSIAVDKNGIVWLGTDNGVMSFNNGEFTSYK
jgi:ligand-binding sensor domain-containing protein